MYKSASPLAPYVAPSASWRGVLTQHGAVGGAAAIVASYASWCAKYGIDANLALAQACHESTYFTSERWVNEWNPAGLGVTSGNVILPPYASFDQGIQAHVEHLCAYIYGAATCPCDHLRLADRRHFFHLGRRALAGLEAGPKWAVPGDGYVAGIVAIANEVTAGGQPMSNVPTEADIGYPVRIDYASLIGPARDLGSVKWFVQHDTEGGYQGSLSVLKGNTASVHALIDTDGALTFMVPLGRTAWTAGNDQVSRQAVQCEWVGFASKGYTEDQYRSGAAFVRWCIAQGMTGVPVTYIGKVDADGGPEPDVPGILGHQDVPNPDVPGRWGGVSGHTDPGPLFKWDHFLALIGSAPAPAPVDELRFPETGQRIIGAFKAYFLANGGLDVFGYPIGDEEQENGITVQYFQRARLELHGDQVVRGLVGSDLLKARGRHGLGID